MHTTNAEGYSYESVRVVSGRSHEVRVSCLTVNPPRPRKRLQGVKKWLSAPYGLHPLGQRRHDGPNQVRPQLVHRVREVPGTPYGIASEFGPAEFGATRPNPSGRWSGRRDRPI